MAREGPTVLLGLLACTGAHFAAAQGSSAQVVAAINRVDRCVERLDAQVDVGFERIAARCPQLVRDLQQTGLSSWLPGGWNQPDNDLSARNLTALGELARRELAIPSASPAVDLSHLKRILADLNRTAEPRPGAWQRFKSWLRSVLESGAQPAGPGWLARLIDQAGISQALIELVSIAALAVVVALAGLVLFNEIRIAGPRRFAGVRLRRSRAATDLQTNWGEIDAVPPAERPGLLLERITRRLTGRGDLPPSGAMTARELTTAAHLPEAERARLTEVAAAAERVRFSGRQIRLEDLERALAAARRLLDWLELGVADAGQK